MTQNATVGLQNPMISVGEEGEGLFYGLSMTAWAKITVVAVLMALTFRFNLLRLWLKTNPFFGEPNWRHAICVPAIGLYYLFVHREELLETETYTAWGGLGILVFGILLFGYGIYPGQNDFVKDTGMIVALFGVVALLCGWQVMKIAWFPIVFLICAIPWPELVYSFVASPLQRLAATVAVHVLHASNVEAFHSGTKIIISGNGNTWRTLNVAEACAGLRSLMTFISVAAAVAFLSARPLWQKVIVTFSAIPIAIFCNVMRVSGQGLLDHYVSQTWSEGFAHQFAGIVMLVPGFLFILLTGWLLDQVFVEVVDEREQRRKRAALAQAKSEARWNAAGGAMEPTKREVVEKAPARVAAVASGPARAPLAANPTVIAPPAVAKVATPAVAATAKAPAPAAKPAAASPGVVKQPAAPPVTPKVVTGAPATAPVAKAVVKPGVAGAPTAQAPNLAGASAPTVAKVVAKAPLVAKPAQPAAAKPAGSAPLGAPPVAAKAVAKPGAPAGAPVARPASATAPAAAARAPAAKPAGAPVAAAPKVPATTVAKATAAGIAQPPATAPVVKPATVPTQKIQEAT